MMMLGDDDDIAMAMGGGVSRDPTPAFDPRKTLVINVGIFAVFCIGVRIASSVLNSE